MAIYKELEDAIAEESGQMEEAKEFCFRFEKLIANYMDNMGAESEIAELIEAVALPEVSNED